VDQIEAVRNVLFQALLDHFWRARDASAPPEPYLFPKGYLVSYGDLIRASGVDLNPRLAGGPLFHVAEYCALKGWPPVHSLVVRKDEGYPGEGYFHAPGSDAGDDSDLGERLRLWDENVRACAKSNVLPRKAFIVS
jgi:hypothetical protein